MPIKVSCKCGKAFSAKDELAGKAVKCPGCGKPLRIPVPQRKAAPAASPPTGGLADLLDEEGIGHHHEEDQYEGAHCPSCNAPVAHNAVLCTECGFHLETGKFVKGMAPLDSVTATEERAEGHAGAAERLLRKAETAIVEDKVEQRKNRVEGMPVWMLAAGLAIGLTFCVTMTTLPGNQAAAISGWTCVIICMTVNVVCGIMLIVLAFQQGAATGLMYLFIPFYALYFIIVNWSDCKRLFLIQLGSSFVAQLGVGLLSIAPNLGDDRQSGGLPSLQPVPAVSQVASVGAENPSRVPTMS